MIYLGIMLLLVALGLTVIAAVAEDDNSYDAVFVRKLEQVILVCLCSGVSLLVINS